MKKLVYLSFIILFINPITLIGQYEFSGYVNKENWSGDIYLSLIEDYRQLSGVYPKQIIQKTTIDSTGYFRFFGDHLPEQNHMYRIHIENCMDNHKTQVHFNGFCPESEEVLFIANNTDKLSLPLSFDDEMFCKIISGNEKSNAFIKVDSIIDEMRFAFASYRSETNNKINTRKWFTTLQRYVKNSNEPLTEVYTYAFLSDKSNNLYSYYIEDLKKNPYYDELLERLQKQYPNSTYTNQYKKELASDKFLINHEETSTKTLWHWLLIVLLILSVTMNIFQYLKKKKTKNTLDDLNKNLTLQEQKVLALILQDKTNKEIASSMFVSLSTVKTHINNLYKKLEVSSRSEVKLLYINK